MTDAEREAITEAAHRHAVESRKAQGLPPVVTDPDVLRKVATLIVAHRAKQKRAA